MHLSIEDEHKPDETSWYYPGSPRSWSSGSWPNWLRKTLLALIDVVEARRGVLKKGGIEWLK
jgi:hypothetical protein